MPAIESKGNYFMSSDLLAKLEGLVDLRDGLSESVRAKATIGEAIIYTLKRLTETDVNTSISDAIMTLERLAMLRGKVGEQSPSGFYNKDDLQRGLVFNKMIDSKIEFIRRSSFSRLHDIDECFEPLNALKRLVQVQRNLDSKTLDDLLDAKIKEVVYYLKVKVSPRNDPLLQRRCN